MTAVHFLRYGLMVLVFSTMTGGCRRVPVKPAEMAVSAETESVPSVEEVSGEMMDTVQVFADLRWKETVFTFYQSRNFVPLWSENPEEHLSDSLALVIENAVYYGLSPHHYNYQRLLGDELDQPAGFSGLRKDVLLTDTFLSMLTDLGAESSVPDTDSVRHGWLRGALTEGLDKQFRSREPSFVGYWSLKTVLKGILDGMPAADRNALLVDASVESDSLQRRLSGIFVNLERWRSIPEPATSRYILINIPAFRLDYVVQDSVIFSARVIVGTRATQTPRFHSEVEYLTVYPYWYVPRRIAVEEFLPLIRRDRDFISRNHFDVLNGRGVKLDPDSVPWDRYSRNNFPVSLRQREGAGNSLGLVKFYFENPFGVYLHDTNVRQLFARPSRAFSHGCVRMERAIEFAHLLTTGQLGARNKLLDQYLKNQKRETIYLADPVPVFLVYFTVEAISGNLYEYPDLYSLDR